MSNNSGHSMWKGESVDAEKLLKDTVKDKEKIAKVKEYCSSWHNTKEYFFYTLERLDHEKHILISGRNPANHQPVEFRVLNVGSCEHIFDGLFLKNTDDLSDGRPQSNVKGRSDTNWKKSLKWFIVKDDESLAEINSVLGSDLIRVVDDDGQKKYLQTYLYLPYPRCFSNTEHIFKFVNFSHKNLTIQNAIELPEYYYQQKTIRDYHSDSLFDEFFPGVVAQRTGPVVQRPASERPGPAAHWPGERSGPVAQRPASERPSPAAQRSASKRPASEQPGERPGPHAQRPGEQLGLLIGQQYVEQTGQPPASKRPGERPGPHAQWPGEQLGLLIGQPPASKRPASAMQSGGLWSFPSDMQPHPSGSLWSFPSAPAPGGEQLVEKPGTPDFKDINFDDLFNDLDGPDAQEASDTREGGPVGTSAFDTKTWSAGPHAPP